MMDRIRTVAYFTIWGLIYGFLLGTFSGTAIYPYFGTMYSVIWGTGIGAACGLLSGVMAAVMQAAMFHHDADLDRLRRRMALVIGGVTGVAAPALLIATTRGFLWGTGMLNDLSPFTALSLFAASFWGSLSSAYVGSYYPQFMARLTARRDYDALEIDVPAPEYEVSKATSRLLRYSLNRWVFMIGSGIGGLINMVVGANFAAMTNRSISLPEAAAYFVIGGVLGVIGTAVVALYEAIGNAALLTFLKRLIFREYFSHMPPAGYRWTLTLITFIFTLAVTYWTIFLAPVIALISAVCVYMTLAAPDELPDKAKRKEKNSLALEDTIEAGEEDEDEERLIVYQQQ